MCVIRDTRALIFLSFRSDRRDLFTARGARALEHGRKTELTSRALGADFQQLSLTLVTRYRCRFFSCLGRRGGDRFRSRFRFYPIALGSYRKSSSLSFSRNFHATR